MKVNTLGYVVLLLGLMMSGEAISPWKDAANAYPLPTTVTRSSVLAQHSSVSTAPIQSERIYISADGDLLGAFILVEGTALFIDTAGRLSLSARDYTTELDYDYRGKLNRIGSAEISYDYTGRTQQVGSTRLSYGYRGNIAQVGNADIAYTSRGKVSQIGDVTIRYNRNRIDTISSNYTSAGTRVIVVNSR